MDLDLVTRITAELAQTNEALQAEIAVRRRAEETLRESEERFRLAKEALQQSEAFARSVFESSADCIMILDADGRLLQMNGPGQRLMDIDDFAAVRGRDWLWLWEGPARDAAHAAVRTARANGIGRFQGCRPAAEEEPCCFDVLVTTVRTGELPSQCLVAVARDLTYTRQAEENLRLRDRALEAASAGILIVDARRPDQPIVYVNQGFQTLTGYTAAEVLGRNCRLLQGPGSDARARAEMREAVRAGRSCRTEILNYRKDGTAFWNEVVITPVQDESGQLTHFIGVQTDISHRRYTEQALRRNAAQFRSLAESGPQMIWMADAGGHYEYVNRKWTEYTGLTLGQTRDKEQWRRTLHPDDSPPLPERLATAFFRGEPFHGEVRLRHADSGVYRWFLVRAEPVLDDQGHISQWVGAVTDIDDQKQAEMALLEADRGKDEFLAMLAHELRNPLAPIRNAVQMLHAIEAGDKLRWAQEIIDRQVKHLSRLVDDLLDVSRITRGKITLQKHPVSVADVVAQAIETSRPLIEGRKHRLEVKQPGEPVRVLADPTRLAQVILNLLNNAAKYTEEGGRIWLTVERAAREAVIRVRDNGLGIPREMLPRIFDLFTQVDRTLDRAQGGLGIGLMLVRRLVQMHGGSVAAASDGPGRGSEFTVRLPLLAESAADGDGAGTVEETLHPARRQRILVVDDNRDSADSLTMLLRLAGHEVVTAYDGEVGLDVARRWQPDVVLLDIGLPRLDGYEVARQLRRDKGLRKALVVAMTGYGKDEDRQRSQEAGFNAHLVKPVDLDELARLIAALSPV
jgi:PAS domain S-box-containing protein